MNTDVMFSSASDDWETPQYLFDELNEVYHFETDVCATPENAKCARFFTKEQDGLKQVWGGAVLDESAIRQADRCMGAQGIRECAARRNRCMPVACPDGYGMVS